MYNYQFTPSYREYENILNRITSYRDRLLDYSQITENTRDFIILRHDVEFSVERAYMLSFIETNKGICSTYFFQVTNNTYNIFSQVNIEMVKKMNMNGHRIGLHYHLNGLTNLDDIKRTIRLQAETLEGMTNVEIDRFSIHRPTKDVLKANLQIYGLINAYDRRFFTFVDMMQLNTDLDVKYISDSMHCWNYGAPYGDIFRKNKKIHILIHPYSWTEAGYDNLLNFRSLFEEKRNVLEQTIDSECKHFGGIKHAL